MFSGLSAEVSAQHAVSALQRGMFQEAADMAAFLCRLFPSLSEGHALYAGALTGMNRMSEAMIAWGKAIERAPLEKAWLERAILQGLSLGWDRAVEDWAGLVERIFIHPPAVEVPAGLSRRGLHLRGSVGIHCDQVSAWTWLPADAPPRVEVYGGPSPQMVHSSRTLFENHALTHFILDLPVVDTPFFLRVMDAQGRDIQGSPLTCEPPSSVGGMVAGAVREPLLHGSPWVLVPVYDDKRATRICLACLMASRRACATPFDIVVVWDHGPDNDLFRYLHNLARKRKIQLLTTPRNLGFLGAVNHALRRRQTGDVVLLNADTMVHGDWLDRMHRTARREQNVGTVTPMGSCAELLSYPSIHNPAEISTMRVTAALDRACRRAAADGRSCHEIPVGVGFCMYVTRELLTAVGGLDGYWLFSGYGEEVDLCLRGRKAGFRNLAALDVFVTHLGNRSYGLGKKALAAQNNQALFRRYSHYEEEYLAFLREDPLRSHREAVSRLLYAPMEEPLHLMGPVEADDPQTDVLWRAGECDKSSRAVLMVRGPQGGETVTLRVYQGMELADVSFLLPGDRQRLLDTLGVLTPSRLVLHGFSEPVRCLADQLGLPRELHLGYLPYPLLLCLEEGRPCPKGYFEGIERIHCRSPQVAQWLADAGLSVALAEDGPLHPPPPLLPWPGESGDGDMACLVPLPRNSREWGCLCAEARRWASRGSLFYVPGLETAWGDAPRPANVRHCAHPSTEACVPVQAVLLVSADPEVGAFWTSWASERNIPCYFHTPH